MDSIDRAIISSVFENCRISYEALARQVKLSPNAVKNRVHNLIEDGVLSQFLVVFNPKVIGAESFQAIVTTNGTESQRDFVNTIGSHPAIGHISTLATVKGGAYLVWGEFTSIDMLHEIRTYLRNLEEVVDLEIYVVLSEYKEPLEELGKLHLRVLRALRTNPLMQISEISQQIGLSPKTVRRALREITDSQRVRFIARPDFAAGSLVNLHIRIEWDETLITLEKLKKWIHSEFPLEFWSPWASATSSLMYAEFVVESLQEAECISNTIRESEFVKSSTTLVAYSSGKFPYPSQTLLNELLDTEEE
ncbi:AsnC family transcriptional regulator [Candidatus Thorarchaeota archaeon]|nr:MAG: AsnC family transcriptional regulator [Candidatus Thorarchaeota archaeon]